MSSAHNRVYAISRVNHDGNCESCERPARFRFQYTLEAETAELILCAYHLQDIVQSDHRLMSMVLFRLFEMLDLPSAARYSFPEVSPGRRLTSEAVAAPRLEASWKPRSDGDDLVSPLR